MNKREPISLSELEHLIQEGHKEMHGILANLWDLIKIPPVQWTESSHAAKGEGFWVIAIMGQNVIWYNDISKGFNNSRYTTAGHIDEYSEETDAFNWAIHKILVQLKLERRIIS